MLSLLTDDFSWELLDGQILTRPQAQAMLQQQLGTLDPIEVSGEVLRLTVRDEEAVVLIREKIVGTVQEPEGPPQTLVVMEEYRDTWVRREGDWKIQRGVALSSETRVLGPEFSPRSEDEGGSVFRCSGRSEDRNI